MQLRDVSFLALLLSLASGCVATTIGSPAPAYLADQPLDCSGASAITFREMQQPYVDHARSTYPEAKQRWELGLPEGQTFFITTIFLHPNGVEEQVFVLVDDIQDGVVYGRIANDPMGPGFQPWDAYSFPEADLRDWTIQHPDGREEGNYIGTFIDRFRGECPQQGGLMHVSSEVGIARIEGDDLRSVTVDGSA